MQPGVIRLSLIGLRTCLFTCHRSGFNELTHSFSANRLKGNRISHVIMSPKKVCIIGSGNWGSAIAKLVGENTSSNPDLFVKETPMWVFEEDVNGRKLTEIINTDHENVKYLPGQKLPVNIVAVPNVVDAAKDADVLIVVVPHQFM